MNLKQLQAKLEQKHGILSCRNYDTLLKSVNFNQLETLDFKADRNDGYGIFYIEEPALSIDNNVATIKIRGLLAPDIGWDLVEFGLTGYDVIEHYINYANKSPLVSHIVLDIDSGGGYVAGVQRCGDVISNSQKPIRTFVSGNMHSAAYWLGCSTESITASFYSDVGSIGVYAEHFDRSKELENIGIVARIFRSGKWKGAFSPNRPLTEEEQSRLQQDIDQMANEFFTHVSENRRLSKQAVADFEGDSFIAGEALELGLIDRIENVNQTELGGEGKMENSGKTEQVKALTEDEIEQIKAQAREEAKAEMRAKMEREQAINALQASEDVKKVLASEAFSNVSIDAMSELVKAMPKGYSQAMDETGGADVGADPKGFAPKTKEQLELDEKSAALAELAKLKHKGL